MGVYCEYLGKYGVHGDKYTIFSYQLRIMHSGKASLLANDVDVGHVN